MHKIRTQTRRLTMLGMMLAIITVLSALEHTMPPIPGLPPGVRFGLANIVTMYALFFMDKQSAILLTVLKAGFVLLMRGLTASLLSFCGGMLSILVIIALMTIRRDKISYLILSISGAVAHNIGQISMAAVIFSSKYVLSYLPMLIVSGVVMGSVTGALLRVVMPVFDRMANKKE